MADVDGLTPLVPWIGPRGRYSIVTARSATWVFHKMAAGATLDGTYTQTAGQSDPTQIDPTVTGGQVVWSNLTHGGLFTMLAAVGRELILEDISNPGSATLSTQYHDGTPMRTTLDPANLPINLAPFETIKATGGAAGSSVGFLVRINDATIL